MVLLILTLVTFLLLLITLGLEEIIVSLNNHILNTHDANVFHNRAVNFWNKLPDSVIVLATSISCFKRRLLSFVLNFGSKHFLQTSIS